MKSGIVLLLACSLFVGFSCGSKGSNANYLLLPLLLGGPGASGGSSDGPATPATVAGVTDPGKFRLVSVNPPIGSPSVAVDAVITLTFNKSVDCSTVVADGGRRPILGFGSPGFEFDQADKMLQINYVRDFMRFQVSCAGKQVFLKSPRDLRRDTLYSACFRVGASRKGWEAQEFFAFPCSASRQKVMRPDGFWFRTEDRCIESPPITYRDGKPVRPAGDRPLVICSITPKIGSTLPPGKPRITVRFNKDLDCATYNRWAAPSFGHHRLTGYRKNDPKQGATSVCRGKTLTYEPKQNLRKDSLYTFNVGRGAVVDSFGETTYNDYFTSYPPVFPFRYRTGDGTGSSGGSSGGDGGDGGSDEGQSGTTESVIVKGGPKKACPGRTITLDPTGGRWYETPESTIAHPKLAGRKIKVSGIYAREAAQKLILKVRGNCQAGPYRLRIVAKNIYGPLPDFYKRFHIAVKDADGQDLGALSIRGADDRYHTGAITLDLPSGDSEFQLVWTNDAFEAGKYDANIQIKTVSLRYKRIRTIDRSLVRHGHELCRSEGRWFFGKRTAHTFWKDQTLGFCFPKLKAGRYRVAVVARNLKTELPLPADYKAFQVVAAADGITGDLSIPANSKRYKRGSVVLDLRGGDTLLNLTWLNDRFQEGAFDTNIQIKKVRLRRIGDSRRSGLAAFLAGDLGAREWVLLALLTGVLLGLITVSLVRRRRSLAG